MKKLDADNDVEDVEIISITINNQDCAVYQTKSKTHAISKAKEWNYYTGETLEETFSSENKEALKFFMLITPTIEAPYVEDAAGLENQYAIVDLVINYRVHFSNGATTDLCDRYTKKEDGGGGLLATLQPEDFS